MVYVGYRAYNGDLAFSRDDAPALLICKPDVYRVMSGGVLLAATNLQRKTVDFLEAELIEVIW